MNRRLPRLFFIGFLSLLLFACQQEPENTPVVEPDPTPSALPTPLPPTPSLPPAPTPTPTRQPSAQFTPEATIEAGLFRATTAPTPLPSFVPIDANFINYQLHPPSAEAELIVLHQIARELLDQISQDDPFLSHLNYYSLGQFIEADLATFFPDGFPEAINLLDDESYIVPRPSWYMPTMAHAHILQDGFIQYLQQNQYQLKADETVETEILWFTATPVELDGDLLPEWVVKIDFRLWQTTALVLLKEISPGNYVRLPASFPVFSERFYADGQTTVDVNYDFTGDGISEIIIHNDTYLGGGGRSEIFWIFIWQTDRLTRLQVIDLEYASYERPVYDFADHTGDGIADIRVVSPYNRNLGCKWDETDLYSWNGLTTQFVLETDDYPDIPVCNVYRGAWPFHGRLTVAERTVLLERAVEQFAVEPAPSADYLAFVYFHLAMLYTTEGRDDLARQTLDLLYQLPQDVHLVTLYTEVYESVNHSPLASCRQLLQRAPEMMESEMADYISGFATLGIGGDETEPDARLVCPLVEVVRGRVATLSPLQTANPVTAMTELGYSLAFTQTTNLDSDPELEWIGILEPIAPSLVIFDQTPAGWAIHPTGLYPFDEVVQLTWLLRDVTDDGVDDLLVLLEIGETALADLWPSYKVFLFDTAVADYDLVHSISSYEDEVRLAELPLDFFPPERSVTAAAWKQLEGFNTEATSTYDYVRELVAAVLSPEHSDTLPEDLIALINYLPPDEPEAHYLILQLTYMLGYTYEQEGREEEAIATYLALIQQAPESPWSWLAWARIS